jgi:hypothetical protein
MLDEPFRRTHRASQAASVDAIKRCVRIKRDEIVNSDDK